MIHLLEHLCGASVIISWRTFTPGNTCTHRATLYFFNTSSSAATYKLSKIDLVDEAESVCSHCSLVKATELHPDKNTLTLLRGFRDTTFDLHLAEHKRVKRNYNTEQSPLLTPPGACRLLQSAPALFTPLSVSSTLQTRLPTRFNGVGHQVLLKIEKKREKKTCIDLKMPCSVILKSFHLYFSSLSWRVPRVMVGEFRKCFVISVFFLFFPPSMSVYMCVCSCMYQILSAAEYIWGGRRVIYLTKCSQ